MLELFFSCRPPPPRDYSRHFIQLVQSFPVTFSGLVVENFYLHSFLLASVTRSSTADLPCGRRPPAFFKETNRRVEIHSSARQAAANSEGRVGEEEEQHPRELIDRIAFSSRKKEVKTRRERGYVCCIFERFRGNRAQMPTCYFMGASHRRHPHPDICRSEGDL